MESLSVAIIVKNEGQCLGKCLQSLAGLANEVVVLIDSSTTDNSAAIAKHYNCRIYFREFDNFANQKNYATHLCKNDWVLSLDADETVSPELSQEISVTLPNTKFDAFKIGRLNYIFGKAIKYTNWGPKDDTHVWLFKKVAGKWQGNIHEEMIVTGSVGNLKGLKIHQNYNSVEEYIDKMNSYTGLEADKNNFHWWNPVNDFLRRYLWHKGFLDGWHGLFLSYLQAVSHVSVGVKVWEKARKLS